MDGRLLFHFRCGYSSVYCSYCADDRPRRQGRLLDIEVSPIVASNFAKIEAVALRKHLVRYFFKGTGRRMRVFFRLLYVFRGLGQTLLRDGHCRQYRKGIGR